MNYNEKDIREKIKESGYAAYFPCSRCHEDHDQWYEGLTNFDNCPDLFSGCEWISIGNRFINFVNNEESTNYKLSLCPDKEKKGNKIDSKKPDLLFNNSTSKRFVVEVKELHELIPQKNQDAKSFSELARNIGVAILLDKPRLKALPYGLTMDVNVRWGKNEKQKYTLEILKNMKRILANGFANSPEESEFFQVGGINFCFMILDEESAIENNVSDGEVKIIGPISFGTTRDLKPSRERIQQYLDKVFKSCEKKFEFYIDSDYRRALLIVDESNYISQLVYSELSKVKMSYDQNFEIWFASRIYEEIDEYGNEEFYGSYDFKKVIL
ncbi:hypothetical protein [Paenibacillus tundrae]